MTNKEKSLFPIIAAGPDEVMMSVSPVFHAVASCALLAQLGRY